MTRDDGMLLIVIAIALLLAGLALGALRQALEH
jgi:hypothetical protein